MKYAFALLLSIHGLIHVMGFVSAFFSTSIEKQVLGISKPIGSIWLITFILFAVSAIQFLGKKKWFYIAFIAVLISQILIIITWNDSKFGTVANVIIFLVSMSAFGSCRFQKMVEHETNDLLEKIAPKKSKLIVKSDIDHLPFIVQRWLLNSGIIDIERIISVRLKQSGKMKTSPKSKWLSFNAEQYFDVSDPSFIWSAQVDYLAVTSLLGRDKFLDGKGDMLIKIAGLIPIVNVAQNERINSASMLRYMAEMVWFPSAALSDYITWEAIDEHKAKATFTYNEKSVSGVFEFSEDGNIVSFEAQRFYNSNNQNTLETWFILTEGHQDFEGFRIPTKCKVIWKLKEGDFHWLNFSISDVTYNLDSKLKAE